MSWLLLVTAIMGAVCFLYSGVHFVFFAQSTRVIAKAVMWMIGGETIAMAIFTAFSTMELLGIMPTAPTSTAMRWTAFIGTFASSVHMTWAVRKIQDADHRNE